MEQAEVDHFKTGGEGGTQESLVHSNFEIQPGAYGQFHV